MNANSPPPDERPNSTASDPASTRADEEQFYKPAQLSPEERRKLPIEQRVRLLLKDLFDSAFRRELPLQNETSFFILANVLDFYMTYLLLQNGGIEANPVANYFYDLGGFQGMLYFKLASVSFICILAQVIARKNMRYAQFVLIAGVAIVGLVVLYSARLLYGQLYL
ncbi:MAG: DUF5658 family protein [Planctomycetota bacterium]|nr:DUF5658 family protein [Planctomycetota bacterium]